MSDLVIWDLIPRDLSDEELAEVVELMDRVLERNGLQRHVRTLANGNTITTYGPK